MNNDADDKVQRAWSYGYLHSTRIYWVLTLFLLLVIAYTQDSIGRDFTLLFGVLSLGGLATFRDFAVKQIMWGRIQKRTRQDVL